MVSRVIAAPVDVVWRYFVDAPRRVEWLADVATVTVLDESEHEVRWHETYRTSRAGAPTGAELRITVLEPGRRCQVGLVGEGTLPHRIYAFNGIEIGCGRGGTMVTAVDDRPVLLADRLFDLVVGGFLARTVEGAVRNELDALAAACTTRVIVPSAA